MHVHEPMADDALEQRTFVGPLADDVRLPLLGMHVHVGAGDIEIAAEDERLSRRFVIRDEQLECVQESHLRFEILAAVRHIDRRDGE